VFFFQNDTLFFLTRFTVIMSTISDKIDVFVEL